MNKFELTSAYKPTGDQPEAIAQLTDGVVQGVPAQTLLGVTGSGKTFTIANVIANINNFNVIYLLSGGNPTPVDATAGKTDLLVTWLYKMTIDYQYYNLGAVIGIMTFIFLAIGSLLVYRRTKAYKDEEGFQ